MREHSFRTTVVESTLSLPTMSVITFLLWMSASKWDGQLWSSLLITGMMTYIIVEWNNQCQLLRIRSRMCSVVFLTMMSMFPALHTADAKLLPSACLLATYFTLFKAYGRYKPEGYVFHAFLFISVGSLYYPPLLLLAPTLFVAAGAHLRVLTLKSVSASILGLILPYWLYGAIMCVKTYYIDRADSLVHSNYISEHFPITTYFTTSLPDFTALRDWHWGALAFMGFLGFVSVVHFVSTSYNDKIRTRQFYYTMLYSFLPIAAIAVWWPDDIMYTLPLLLLNLTPFAAHYLALAKGRAMPYYFWLWLGAAVAIGAANYFRLWTLIPE